MCGVGMVCATREGSKDKVDPSGYSKGVNSKDKSLGSKESSIGHYLQDYSSDRYTKSKRTKTSMKAPPSEVQPSNGTGLAGQQPPC